MNLTMDTGVVSAGIHQLLCKQQGWWGTAAPYSASLPWTAGLNPLTLHLENVECLCPPAGTMCYLLSHLSILLLVRGAASHKWKFSKRWRCGTKSQQEEKVIATSSCSIRNTGTCYRTQPHTTGWAGLFPIMGPSKKRTQKNTDFKTRPHLQELIMRPR